MSCRLLCVISRYFVFQVRWHVRIPHFPIFFWVVSARIWVYFPYWATQYFLHGPSSAQCYIPTDTSFGFGLSRIVFKSLMVFLLCDRDRTLPLYRRLAFVAWNIISRVGRLLGVLLHVAVVVQCSYAIHVLRGFSVRSYGIFDLPLAISVVLLPLLDVSNGLRPLGRALLSWVVCSRYSRVLVHSLRRFVASVCHFQAL